MTKQISIETVCNFPIPEKANLDPRTLHQVYTDSVNSCPQDLIDNLNHKKELARRENFSNLTIAKQTKTAHAWRKFHARRIQLEKLGLLNTPLTESEHLAINKNGVYQFDRTRDAALFARVTASKGNTVIIARHPERGEYWAFTKGQPKNPNSIIATYYPHTKRNKNELGYTVENNPNKQYTYGNHQSKYESTFIFAGKTTPRLLEAWGIGTDSKYNETDNTITEIPNFKEVTETVKRKRYPKFIGIDGTEQTDYNAKPEIFTEEITKKVIDKTKTKRYLVALNTINRNGHQIPLYAQSEKQALLTLKKSTLLGETSQCSHFEVYPVEDSREYFIDEIGITSEQPKDDDERTDVKQFNDQDEYLQAFANSWDDVI